MTRIQHIADPTRLSPGSLQFHVHIVMDGESTRPSPQEAEDIEASILLSGEKGFPLTDR